MAAHEFWTRTRTTSAGVVEEQKAEIYRSSKLYKIRGVSFGINGFESCDEARKFLASRGFARVDVRELRKSVVKSILEEMNKWN